MEFELVNIKNLSLAQREKALWNLWTIYYNKVPDASLFHEFKEATKKANIFCVIKNNDIKGVVSYSVHKKEVFLHEAWAKPSREFIKKYGMTIGNFLDDYVQSIAHKKKINFRRSGFLGAGVRFGKRLNGKLHSLPKPRRVQRKRG